MYLVDFDPSYMDVNDTNIPLGYVTDVLMLIYLLKHRYLTGYDVIIIFKTLIDQAKKRIPASFECPFVDTNAYRVGYLFVEFQCVFNNCLNSIGMEKLTVFY
jgi:hypothetical protein